MGWPSCINTAPMPLSLASVSMMNVFSKLGMLSTGAELRAALSTSKAS